MKIIVIGGVAAGATAAARARRLDENAEIVIYEKGPYVSFANCGIPYHMGGVITNRESLLLLEPEFFQMRFNIKAHVQHEVIEILREKKTIKVKNLQSEEIFETNYDKLIIATGASPATPPIEGLPLNNVHSLWTIPDMDSILTSIKNKKEITIVGGGFVGIEVAENLIEKGFKVTLIEFLDQILPPLDKEMTQPLAATLASKGCQLKLSTGVKSIQQQEDKLVLQLSTGESFVTEYVILSTGVKPNSDLAKQANIEVNARGAIITNDFLQTNDENIFAAGDVTEVTDPILHGKTQIPLASPANKQGRICAQNAVLTCVKPYGGTIGTSCIKVFDYHVASTGLNEKQLKRANINYKKVYVHPFNHVTYYPGAKQLHLKLIFDADSHLILGAQCIGKTDVVRKIDVIATAIKGKLTIGQLAEVELAYAPPFGAPKDAINHAAMYAQNMIDGLTLAIDPTEIKHDDYILDVREPDELLGGKIPNAINIPIDNLRAVMNQLPKDQRIVIYCQVGFRGYAAERILSQHGYNVCNLAGGFTTWKMFNPSPLKTAAPIIEIQSENEFEHKQTPQNIPTLDVRGLPCPGPIVALKNKLDTMKSAEMVELIFEEEGFKHDLEAFCQATGNTLVSLTQIVNQKHATIAKKSDGATPNIPLTCGINSQNDIKRATIVLFSGDLDKALGAFIIANGYAALGMKVSIFCTFWGLNVLKKTNPPSISKSLIAKMFDFMLPRGANKLKLSKMNFGGAGTFMIKEIMKANKVPSLEELIAQAKGSGVELLACEMAMNLMGVSHEELLDGVQLAGVGKFAALSSQAESTLFI